jgi:predicted DNA-binding protein
MPNNKIVVTKEQIQKAMTCETAEELMELAKEVGIELTKEEAEAYMAEIEDFELDGDTLKRVAGGGCYMETAKLPPETQKILKSTTAILM